MALGWPALNALDRQTDPFCDVGVETVSLYTDIFLSCSISSSGGVLSAVRTPDLGSHAKKKADYQ